MLQAKHVTWLLVPLLLFVAGCQGGGGRCCPGGAAVAPCGVPDDEVEIPVDQLPAVVREAALAAVPGLVIEEAESVTENGFALYDVEGTADGRRYEIEVTADGQVTEIELDGEDDDEDDDD